MPTRQMPYMARHFVVIMLPYAMLQMAPCFDATLAISLPLAAFCR